MIESKIEKETKAIRVMMGSPCLLLYVHHWYTLVTYLQMLLVLEILPIYTFLLFFFIFLLSDNLLPAAFKHRMPVIFLSFFVALYFVDEVYVRGFVICVHITWFFSILIPLYHQTIIAGSRYWIYPHLWDGW